MKYLLLALISPLAMANVFNGDSRYEARLEANADVIERARSVPAFFRTTALKKRSDGDYNTVNWSTNNMGFCSDARFAGQPHLANCSASLIAPDVVLTAAHCIENLGLSCGDFKIVFDFAMGENLEVIAKEKVYECAEVLYYNFDQTLASDDIAIVRLNRKVLDREPITISTKKLQINDDLSMIGYPLGLPQKADDDGNVTSIDRKNISFKHNLDTFSCNSGGPVFNRDGEQVGVLVRGTGSNQTRRDNQNCYDWSVAGASDYAESNSIVHLKKTFKKLGVTLD